MTPANRHFPNVCAKSLSNSNVRFKNKAQRQQGVPNLAHGPRGAPYYDFMQGGVRLPSLPPESATDQIVYYSLQGNKDHSVWIQLLVSQFECSSLAIHARTIEKSGE